MVPTESRLVTEQPGDLIGPYKLLQQIGEGGMGVVYMAEQTHPVERRVAFKIIKPGMDTQQVIARFEAERQALAMMDHPNIAKVLDAGTTSTGRPFFVMELVKGLPITQYCDEQHLSPRERLELFIPICQAVQHAHQKGIIHRDLKPSNILIARYDDKPVPKVIDFGVAKATSQKLTERTMFTQYGQLVGTIDYMSPEQAQFNQLDVDTRSDIYSLGVLLYELLTGETPFDQKRLRSAAYEEMLRIIREEEPPRPSVRLSSCETLASVAANRHMEPHKLGVLVRGELDWIVMKALEKDRTRRYETANGFAMDVQRYLADEPVQACPPSAVYRFKKFARRNKTGVAVAGLVLFFLVLLGSGIGWAVRDRSARVAEAARQQAERQAKVAGQAESILTEVDRLALEQKWPEALSAVRGAKVAVAGGEADEETAERVRQCVKDLELIDRLARIRLREIASAQWGQSMDQVYARAFRDYGVDVDELPVEASIERLKAHPALAIPLGAALDDWVPMRRASSKGDDAGWKRLVAIAHGIDPDPVRDRLRSILWPPGPETGDELRRLTDSIDIWAQHPATLTRLVFALQDAGQSDSTLRILGEAYYVNPGDFNLNLALAGLAEVHNDAEGQIRFYTAAISLRPHGWQLYSNLRHVLREHGKLDELAALSRKQDEEAIGSYRKVVSHEPKNAGAYYQLGAHLHGLGKLDEAIDAYRKSVEADPKSAGAYSALVNVLRAEGKADEAIAVYRQAVEAKVQCPDEVLYSISAILRDRGKVDDANAVFDKALEPVREAIKRNSKGVGPYLELARSLRSQGKLDEATAALRTAIEIDPIQCVRDTNVLNALRDQGMADVVIALYRKVIEVDPKQGGGASLNFASALAEHQKYPEAIDVYHRLSERDPKSAYSGLGTVLSRQGKLDEAIDAYSKAIELDPKSSLAAGPYFGLGNVFSDQNNLPAAILAYRRAIELDPHNLAAGAYNNLGNALTRQSKWDQAIAAFRKAIELDQDYARAKARNDLAWILATCPEAKFRDPIQAVALAKEAVELHPKSWPIANTLGVAQYRAGNWNASIDTLEKSMELIKGGNSNDWFILAMAHWQLGEKDKARQWYDRAVQWMDMHQPKNEELRRFRAEASELLKVEEKK